MFTRLFVASKLRIDALKADRGATAVEYALIIGLIAVVIIVAVQALGGTLSGLFTNVNDELTNPTP